MKEIRRTITLFLFSGIVFLACQTDVFAMGGTEIDMSKSAKVQTLLKQQTHSSVTNLQIEQFYQYFMTESSWAPGKKFPYTNGGNYAESAISDGIYTYNAGRAKGCMHSL